MVGRRQAGGSEALRIGVDDQRGRALDAAINLARRFLQKRVVQNDDQIRPLDIAPSIDRFGAEPGEGNHRRAAPFGAEQSEVLGVKSGEYTAVA